MHRYAGAALAVLALVVVSRLHAQESDPLPATNSPIVINGLPLTPLGKPVGGVLGFAKEDGTRQEIQAGPHGTFLVRIICLDRRTVPPELTIAPAKASFRLREMPMPMFLPPGHSLSLTTTGDPLYWTGYDVP
jgi:hypothetical protein